MDFYHWPLNRGCSLNRCLLMEVQQCIVILKCMLGWARESKRLYSKGNAMTTEDMTVHVKGLNPTSTALNLPSHCHHVALVRALASHQCGLGWHHMWFEFVVGSLPCSKRFFSSFPFSSKSNISRFQFDQESGRRRTTMWMCYLLIVIYY